MAQASLLAEAPTLPSKSSAILNDPQRLAASHGDGALLVIAGAGTGKTTMLAHRVAHLIAAGTDPSRILLLTFARRAAAELLRRVDAILRDSGRDTAAANHARDRPNNRVWGGTFHAVAARLLRIHGQSIGLAPEFTICDRADAEDLLDVVRTELGLSSPAASGGRRFPRKGTCLEIYSRCVSATSALEDLLARAYPWCVESAADLKRLFAAYCDRKAEQSVLDYDDLLLYWHGLLGDPVAGEAVRARFACVLVDEYQDTNLLQADILRRLRPDGRGLTVVGDDAQSIYSFRAATVRNILDFPTHYPGATVITLDQNYRSTPALLDATNRIIAQSTERYEKNLWSHRAEGPKPTLAHCQDEDEQTAYVIDSILGNREAGTALRRQAVLFRTTHHSNALEVELTRRSIPFHKYGGLKFMESAHIKDALAFLRVAENPRDVVAGMRLLLLLPGIGPRRARQLMDGARGPRPLEVWNHLAPPSPMWPEFLSLMNELMRPSGPDLAAQLALVRSFYSGIAEKKYDNASARLRDVEQLEQLAARHPDRSAFLVELTLDPPASTQDLAGPPSLDEDYLILSTIHSAKGLEWDAVYLLHAADGNIPSDLSTGRPEEVAEELRLFYVAASRAKDSLHVCFPLRYYTRPGFRSDRHTYAQLTRFMPPSVLLAFDERPARPPPPAAEVEASNARAAATGEEIRRKIRAMWS